MRPVHQTGATPKCGYRARQYIYPLFLVVPSAVEMRLGSLPEAA